MKIIQDGQKLLDRAGDREIAEIRPFARFPLPGILKLRLQTSQPVHRLVALAFEAIDFALQMSRSLCAAGLACTSAGRHAPRGES